MDLDFQRSEASQIILFILGRWITRSQADGTQWDSWKAIQYREVTERPELRKGRQTLKVNSEILPTPASSQVSPTGSMGIKEFFGQGDLVHTAISLSLLKSYNACIWEIFPYRGLSSLKFPRHLDLELRPTFFCRAPIVSIVTGVLLCSSPIRILYIQKLRPRRVNWGHTAGPRQS